MNKDELPIDISAIKAHMAREEAVYPNTMPRLRAAAYGDEGVLAIEGWEQRSALKMAAAGLPIALIEARCADCPEWARFLEVEAEQMPTYWADKEKT